MIKKLLHKSMVDIFRNEIEEAILFVKRESQNMVIRCPSMTASNIKIKGYIDSLKSFSLISPDTIKGMAIITEKVTYWIEIISDNAFEIRCCSNMVGRSTIILLKIQRVNKGQWIVENQHLKNIPQNYVLHCDNEMIQKAFDILIDYGNPYSSELNNNNHSDSNIECLIKVDEAILNVNGYDWFSIPDF